MLLLLTITTLIPFTIATGGIFQLQLHQTCQGPCPTHYQICIKNYQISIDNQNCYIGSTLANTSQTDYSFEFKFRWPGTFSMIVETLQNSVTIDRLATQQYLEIDSKWREEEYNGTNRIKYKFRVVCLKNYYGKDCGKYCKARDDKFGHYYCEGGGGVRCLEGWEGEYCEKALCTSTCSPLHGYCIHPSTCICHAGWTGPDCTECKQYPGCKNGKCQKQWECECYEGWGGLFCNQDLNYCTNHRPCRNGGVCFNTGQGSYTCECPIGWGGVDCEVKGEECKNGTCYSTLDESPPKPDAPPINLCLTAPCANGGTCTPQANKFTCTCPPGFSGPDCSCSCANSATCDSKSNCICPPGYYGPRCTQSDTNFTLGMIQQIINNEEELTNEHIIFIIISSISIPFLVLFSVGVIYVMRKRRLVELERTARIATEQNEINTMNNINKMKDVYMANNIYKSRNEEITRNLVDGAVGNNETVQVEHLMNENLERALRRGGKNVNYSYQPDGCFLDTGGGGGMRPAPGSEEPKFATQV